MLLQLALTSTAMALVGFVGGIPPLILESATPTVLPRVQGAVGGVLVSACITLVLPECFPTQYSGAGVLAGFLALYAVDWALAASQPSSSCTAADDFELCSDEGTLVEYGDPRSLVKSVATNSTTVGLLLHCLADGVLLTTALAQSPASSTPQDDQSSHSSSLFMVLALFIHKLPAAFSLSTMLLTQGLQPAVVVIHLLAFSLSAPLGAWLTYLLLLLGDTSWLGSFLLPFSGGAFLYVAHHSLSHAQSLPFLLLGACVPLFAIPFND